MVILKKSLSAEVASRLTEQILSGEYVPGDKLPVEPELMKLFGVGRSTIREAIKLLVNSGMLRVQQGLGTFVQKTPLNRETVEQRLQRAKEHELDEVRQLLELKIAEKAALNRSEQDLHQMKEHLAWRKTAAENNDLSSCIDADIAFHTAIAAASGNEILADLYRATSSHLREWFISTFSTTDVFIASYSLHRRLLIAIEAKDQAKAWKIASEIIAF